MGVRFFYARGSLENCTGVLGTFQQGGNKKIQLKHKHMQLSVSGRICDALKGCLAEKCVLKWFKMSRNDVTAL